VKRVAAGRGRLGCSHVNSTIALRLPDVSCHAKGTVACTTRGTAQTSVFELGLDLWKNSGQLSDRRYNALRDHVCMVAIGIWP